MTPDQLRHLFDSNAMVIMLIWGVVHTRVPALAKIPNALVPWVNAIGYILAQFVVPQAHAGVLGGIASGAGFLWTAAAGAVTSAGTSILYDKFLKHWLDKYLPAQPNPNDFGRPLAGRR